MARTSTEVVWRSQRQAGADHPRSGFSEAGGNSGVAGPMADAPTTMAAVAAGELFLDEDRLAIALDIAGILGTTVTDLRTGLVTPDARFARSFGLAPEVCQRGLPVTELRDLIHPDDRPATFTDSLPRAGSFADQLRILLPDGSTPWVKRMGRVDFDAAGQARRIICVLQTIGGRNAAEEEAQRAAEARASETAVNMQAILDAAPVAIWVAYDVDCQRIAGNRAGRDILHIALPDVNLSKSIAETRSILAHFQVLDADGRKIDPENMPVQRAARGETLLGFEERLIFSNGEERWLHGNAVPLLDGEGRPRGAVAAFADITMIKRTEAALAESERFLRSVLDAQPECVKVCDLDGRLIAMNPAGLAMLDLDGADLVLGQDPACFVDEKDRAAYTSAQAKAVEAHPPEWLAFGVTGAKGRRLQMEGRATPLRNSDDAVTAVLWTTRDVTQRHAAESALRESEFRFRNLADHSPAIMWLTDAEGACTYRNAKWFEITGQIEAEIIGQGWLLMIHPDDRPASDRVFQEARDREEPFSIEYRIRAANGGWRWMLDAGAPRRGPDGVFQGFVGSTIDISDRKLAEQQLAQARKEAEHAASHDSLTGLLCRGGFHARLLKELAGCLGEGHSALLLVDLDEFKSVNDALGHPAGDILLCMTADRLRSCVRQGDLLGRVGGDEFVLLLRNLRDDCEAEVIAKHIIGRLGENYQLNDYPVVIGASVGIAPIRGPHGGADDLLKRADIALYSAKVDGRGAVRVFDSSLEAAVIERQALNSDLRGAAARGELRLLYQPIWNLEDGQVVGAEALIRWQHPKRGLIGPARFIPLAEETGEIDAIGAWVLREACREAARWPSDKSVSVNLSPRQFRGSASLVGVVQGALVQAGLAAHRLQVEITESVLLDDDKGGYTTLKDLRAMGVRVAIDDFGTGYSSLGYLRRLDVDIVKIDRSFISSLVDDARSQTLLRALIGLCKDLGLTLVAEGVETSQQADRLREMGCGLAQGFLVGPATEARHLWVARSELETR